MPRETLPSRKPPKTGVFSGKMHVNVQLLRRPKLPLLGTAKLRIAQLSSAHPFDSAELFPPKRWPQLQSFAPHVMAGSSADLRRLVERMDLRTLRVDSLDHSIFVATEIGDKPLTDLLRVGLWQRFGVPVFEVYTDGCGTVLAYECEAHSGWHVETGSRFAVYEGELLLQKGHGTAVRTGLARQLESEMCACGRAGVRIIHSDQSFERAEEPILSAIA